MSSTSSPTRRASRKSGPTKGDRTRQAIKDVTRQVIARDGFANVRVSTIMAAADRTPGAFYRHFPSKEALLRELLEDFRLELKQKVNAPFSPEDDIVLNLREGVRAFWTVYRENWPIATTAFQLSMVDPDFNAAWRAVRQVGAQGMSKVIRKAQRIGYCPGLDAGLAASALCSMFEYTCYSWNLPGAGEAMNGEISDDTAVQVLSKLAVNAVLWRTSAPGGEPASGLPAKAGEGRDQAPPPGAVPAPKGGRRSSR